MSLAWMPSAGFAQHAASSEHADHLQIIGNKANYAGLQRDTGTELSVLLVP